MVCHGELVRIRPPASRLTSFYLAIAAGGSLGGLSVALLAPAVLQRLWEYPFFVVLPLPLLLVALYRDPRRGCARGSYPDRLGAAGARHGRRRLRGGQVADPRKLRRVRPRAQLLRHPHGV